jgi:serine protease Do
VRSTPFMSRMTVAAAAMVFGVASIACAGGGNEAQQLNQEPQPVVTQTIIANPEEMQQVFTQVADRVLPAVVEVNVMQTVEHQPQSLFDYFFGPQQEGEHQMPGLGSGVIVQAEDGRVYIVTNYHVVLDADEISIVLHDGREFTGNLVGGDERTDLALLEFESDEEFPVIEFANSDGIRIGHWVLAIGNPFGFASTVTVGIVSAVGRTAQPGMPIGGATEYIQTDAAINPGNSGGALVDLSGRLVGINSWIASQTGGSVGIGFAIPTNVVRRVVSDLISEGRVVYGWLGVTPVTATAQALPGLAEDLGVADVDGVLIDNVLLGSPAVNAGVRPGDYVTSVNGTEVSEAVEFVRLVGDYRPGTEISLTVMRAGEEQTISVTLGEQPPAEETQDPANLWPGMNIVPVTDQLRQQAGIPAGIDGVIAVHVFGNSPAAMAGLQRGDVIEVIDGESIDSAQTFYEALEEADASVDIGIIRGGAQMQVTMQR